MNLKSVKGKYEQVNKRHLGYPRNESIHGDG